MESDKYSIRGGTIKNDSIDTCPWMIKGITGEKYKESVRKTTNCIHNSGGFKCKWNKSSSCDNG